MNIDAKHLAGLAKLRIEDAEAERFAAKMKSMLELMENLPTADGELEALDEDNAMTLRPDVVQPSLDRDDLLSNAPEKNAGCFVVPKTV